MDVKSGYYILCYNSHPSLVYISNIDSYRVKWTFTCTGNIFIYSTENTISDINNKYLVGPSKLYEVLYGN